MKLCFEDDIFICHSSFEERFIPKEARFRWNPKKKKWWTDDPEKALRLVKYADESTIQRLESIKEERQQALEQSRATDAEIDIPKNDGLEYLPFQKAGIAFASDKYGVLIADEMGLGKTIQALGIINNNDFIKSALIICPASLKINWRNEAEKWLTRPFSIGIANSKEPFPSTDIVIINYDIVKKFKGDLDFKAWDIMIVDECHYLKNPKAQRTALVLGRKKKGENLPPIPAVRRVMLTGTPILNKPVELFPIVNALDKVTWPSFWKYAMRYCNGFQNNFGWDFTGASHLDELQEKLRSTIMVRRLKKDVLTELPAKRRQIIELPWNGVAQILEKERVGWQEANHRLEELQIAAEIAKASDDPEVYKEAVQALKREAVVAFSTMSRLRHDTAVAKIPQAIEHLKDAIDGSGKVICFVHHHDVVDALKDHFGDQAVVLTGRTKNEDRQKAVERFQNDEECKLFIGSIQAAGVGITLTAASHVVFVELDWVPGNMCQAEDRAHRIGQQESVLIQHLVFDGSLDANMAKTLVHKQAIIEKALDLETEKDEETEDHDMILAESVVSDEVKRSAARSARRADLDAEAARLTEEQIKAIHAALVRLAQMCDGAMALDGMGFNRIDTAIGHDLAYRVFLTPRQAALGKKIVRKYRGQLGEDMMEAIGGNS